MTITELNRKQTAYKNKLKKIEQFVNSFQYVDETKDCIELTSKLNSINDIIKELDNLLNEYCSLPDKVEWNNSLEILSDMEEDAEKFKVSILVFLSKYEEQKKENAKLSPKSHIKLPDLPLPTFSGKFQEFENFKTQFMSVIGNNDSLNESQKLMYLKSALKNEAALIQSDQDNFDSLLKALENSSFHNTKLHRDKTDVSISSTAEAFIDTAPKVNSEQCFALRSTDKKNSKPMKYLMSTAVAYVNGMPVRIILDSASEINFISSDCAISLGLKRNQIHSSVSGINGLAQDIKYETNAIISNKDNSFNESLKFMVVPKISSVTPSCNLDISKLSLPKHIKLADPSFHKPAKISMLLGAQVFFKIIKADQIKINDSITLQNSVFNYIVTGGLPTADDKLHCFLLSEQEGLENLICKFWQLQSLEDESLNLNSQTKLCEDHFVNNHRRDQTGHYIVQMAVLKEPSCLGESKQTAIRQLNSLWRKLEANPNLQQLYRNFIHEYLDMGHLEQVFEVSEPTVAYYMPHHGVLRPDSKSTPLRTVFDASCATTTGESLNSILANGGVIQDELFAILLRFRKNRIGLISDIKKMFRMIFIDESQRDLLRIVWKESIDDSIKTYKMNRVVYGTTCAPYLAQRVLKQLVMDDGHNYPLAASAVSSDMYMDDLLTGAADIYSAKQLKEQLIALLTLYRPVAVRTYYALSPPAQLQIVRDTGSVSA
ncbi:hypothetical protein AVEN_122155-1 [Araneus ventricosus]|uniref:Uncharacterized protein n=1 Tax=Araneus ventricosus TaxID=182803 RepID=A0A4Y2U6B7_ARAVE|nr:hypothetical protein AVEN_122155-1 [Araneus ventricosus]